MYTRRIARPRALRPRHSVENQWDLLAALDIGPPDRIEYPVEMPLGNRTASVLAERLARAGVHGDHRLIVMHVSAGNPFRRWPVGSFAAVAAGLAGRDPARRVVITSGPSDREAADRVIAEAQTLLGHDRGRVLDCGEFSLPELRALVDRAAVYIGGDSGPMHVAATSHVPIVSLVRSDVAGAVGAVARDALAGRVGGDRRSRVPAVRPAIVPAGGLQMPDLDSAATGDRGRRARADRLR